MKQAGELEWKSLTERQRQLRLAELKKKERQLRREGKTTKNEMRNKIYMCKNKQKNWTSHNPLFTGQIN